MRGTWTLRAPRPGFVLGLLTGPAIEIERATLDGAPAPLIPTPAGALLVAYLRADGVLSLEGFLPAPITDAGGEVELSLLPAVRGSLELAHPTLVLQATRVPATGGMIRTEGKLWSGASDLGLRIGEPTAPEEHAGPLVVAHAGVGITVGEGEIRVRSRIQWTLRRGSVQQLAVRVTGLSDDLEVLGRDIASWERSGETLTLQLAAPTSSGAEVELRWSQPLGDASEANFAIPAVQPQGTFRSEASLQLARDGEIEVVPTLDAWNAVAADELPTWGRGLVEGTPTAAYQRGQTTGEGGALSLLRFSPVPGPAAVVDVAAYTLALTQDGRLLGLAKYQIRNERAAFLRIKPPPGTTIVGARIAGDSAMPGRTADGTWLLPLKRSLETVEGLLSFPVEVTLLGDGDDWHRRERRTLALPELDAPIAVSRVTVYLPPQYHSKLEPGDGAVVEAFTEGQGITYGLGLGDEETARADALLQEAVEDYRKNEFGSAQEKLDALGSLGASNANIEMLQSNVDLVTGKDVKAAKSAGTETAIVRRVKDQAKARAADDFDRHKQLEEQAETLYRAGDYAEAERTFEAALDLGGKLENLEQDESVETSRRNTGLQDKLGAVKAAKERKAAVTKSVAKRPRLASRRAKRDQDDQGFASGNAVVYDLSDPEAPIDGTISLSAAGTSPGSQPSPDPEPIAESDPESGAQEESGSLAGTSNNEALYMPQGTTIDADLSQPASEPVRTSSVMTGRSAGIGRRSGRTRFKKSAPKRSRARAFPTAAASPPPPGDASRAALGDGDFRRATIDAPAPDTSAAPMPRERMPVPEVTASALSVVIPAIGERIQYQTLLIEAGVPQMIPINARRRLRRR